MDKGKAYKDMQDKDFIKELTGLLYAAEPELLRAIGHEFIRQGEKKTRPFRRQKDIDRDTDSMIKDVVRRVVGGQKIHASKFVGVGLLLISVGTAPVHKQEEELDNG